MEKILASTTFFDVRYVSPGDKHNPTLKHLSNVVVSSPI